MNDAICFGNYLRRILKEYKGDLAFHLYYFIKFYERILRWFNSSCLSYIAGNVYSGKRISMPFSFCPVYRMVKISKNEIEFINNILDAASAKLSDLIVFEVIKR